jgi:hypothetical protein
MAAGAFESGAAGAAGVLIWSGAAGAAGGVVVWSGDAGVAGVAAGAFVAGAS